MMIIYFRYKTVKMSQFIKVFTRKTNPAPVKTDKAEEKLLDDDQYVPPPGHIGFIKGLRSNPEGGGAAQFVSLGESRMEEVRTWNHASEMFSRSLDCQEILLMLEI